jgi:hypothetical protein
VKNKFLHGAADPAPYLIERCHSLERISVMNYVIDLCANDGHLFVRYANARDTGPSVSVWMVPVN